MPHPGRNNIYDATIKRMVNEAQERIFALLLAFVMLIGVMPVGVFATETTDPTESVAKETLSAEATEETTEASSEATEVTEETEATEETETTEATEATEASEPMEAATEPATEATEPTAESEGMEAEVLSESGNTEPAKTEAVSNVLSALEIAVGGNAIENTTAQTLTPEFHGSKTEYKALIDEIAATCQIESLLGSHPYDLSGGEQQRAALAKVLLTQPKLLLLDEPTKGIDSFFKETLAKILCKLKEQGVTIVMVSHDVEFCARYADLVSMFFDGQILTTDTPRRFFGANSFYTTAANRMSRHVFRNAVTAEDVVLLYKNNKGEE